MILDIFPTKKYAGSVKSNPVSYLLCMKDHNGKTRSVAPEIIGGHEASLRKSIENNHRQNKYTSGVLAFRDGENPTPEQIDDVCKKFLDTFLPGEAQEHVPYLLVAHRDKGNLEIHFVVAKEWLQRDGNTKAFNMAPPGKACLQMQNDFVATTNEELGFKQINPDPFNVVFSKFDHLNKEESDGRRKMKGRIQSGVKKLILKGEVKSRDDLIDFLRENGEVTRVGFDYISFKSPSMKKAIRFKGEFFKEDADYSKLIDQYKEFKQVEAAGGIRLTKNEYEEKKHRLDEAVEKVGNFIKGRFDQSKKSRSRAHLYKVGADGKKKIVKSPTSYKPKRKRGEKPIKAVEPVSQPATANTSSTPQEAATGPVGASQKNPVAQGRGRSSRPSTSAMGKLAGGGSAALMSVQIHQLQFSQLELQLQLGRLNPNVLSHMKKIAELTRKIFELQQKIDALKAKQEQAAEAELIKHLAMMKSGNSPYHSAKI